jgi:predicted nucleotide-binding protein
MERVLLGDNNPVQLQEWSKLLRDEGYHVTEAPSVAATQEQLIKGGFDLAILDLHMEWDDDETDESGLNLARLYRESVPIIILTALPNTSAAIAALQRDGRSAPAVAFIRKKEDGPKALLKAARQAIVPKVFVAHGHDDEVTADVVDFLKTRGAHAVVLREETKTSQTVLEAFEAHANVQFALILMTPDDEGRLKVEPPQTPLPLQARARQNVIFELGFFLAKLGRNRVVALEKQGGAIEQPSNFHGVLTQTIDPGGRWREKLAETMRDAGIALRY